MHQNYKAMHTLKELKKLAKETLSGPQTKIALLGDTATQLLSTAIQGEAVARRISVEFYEGSIVR